MNDLQTTLIPIAEKAGVDVYETDTDDVRRWWYKLERRHLYENMPVPGYTGTLTDAEVTVVLGWLAKAGYEITSEWRDSKHQVSVAKWLPITEPFVITIRIAGDTLHEALAEAVKALPIEAKA